MTDFRLFYCIICFQFLPLLTYSQKLGKEFGHLFIPPQTYVVYQTSEPISIDGKADEPAWSKAGWTAPFVDIEGDLKPKQKVVIIEDLISTGGSSLKAVEAIRKDGSEVLGMVAIFTYGFTIAEDKFKNAKVKLTALSNYDAVLSEALATNYINEKDMETLKEWRQNPSVWKK